MLGYNSGMLSAARLLILSAIVLTGCHTAHRAAVTTFRVIDTPARYVRDRLDPPDATTTTTTTTIEATAPGASDVVIPGRPVTPGTQRPPTTTPSRTTASTAETRPSAAPRTTSSASTNPPPKTSIAPPPTEFPTARPVPGKPGFVYSIDPKGGMVDVTGYKSGDKAKDPYTHQIFVVP